MKLVLRFLAAGWLLVALQVLVWAVRTPWTFWAAPAFLPRFAIAAHAVTIVCGPVAAVQMWRGGHSRQLLMALVAGLSLAFWSFTFFIHGSVPPKVTVILGLSVTTLGILFVGALRR